MTHTQLTAHVEDSIAKSLRHESHIDVGILSIKGFSTGVQRRLVNSLTRLPKDDPCYLEVGLYAGATFCAAINNNPRLTAVGVENFSQPFGDDTIRAQLENNFACYAGDALSAKLVNSDCWAIPPEDLPPLPVDVFYFDGEHSVESQAKALPHFIDQMADDFIFMVDDANWDTVRDGTAEGFAKLGSRVTVRREWLLSDPQRHDGPIWHNGVLLFVCSKTK